MDPDPMDPSLVDPAQRRLAERRLLNGLRRLHRREPMQPDVRLDAVLAAARAMPSRPAGHRGATPLTVDDAQLMAVLDNLSAAGRVVRDGRRVRLAEHRPTLEPVMRERVDRLLDGLRAAGAGPPRVDGVAARLGIPKAVLAQLRASGELVAVAPGIDYPSETWESLRERVDRMAAGGRLTVARARDQLRTSRRHAEAILARWRADRQRVRSRRRGDRGPRPPSAARPR